VQLSDT